MNNTTETMNMNNTDANLNESTKNDPMDSPWTEHETLALINGLNELFAD